MQTAVQQSWVLFELQRICSVNAVSFLQVSQVLKAALQTLRRHDRIKSYRFLLAVAGCTVMVLLSDKPEVNLTLFPAVSHALLVVADQV